MRSIYPWLVLCVRPQHELRIAGILEQRDIDAYVPAHIERRNWSDRVKQFAVPLFSGYVFVRFAADRRRDCLTIPAVNNFLEFGGEHAELTDMDIDTIRRIAETPDPVTPCEVHPGQPVTIASGPLAGVEGVCTKQLGPKAQIVVTFAMLGRSVQVTLDTSQVTPLRKAA